HPEPRAGRDAGRRSLAAPRRSRSRQARACYCRCLGGRRLRPVGDRAGVLASRPQPHLRAVAGPSLHGRAAPGLAHPRAGDGMTARRTTIATMLAGVLAMLASGLVAARPLLVYNPS